MDASRFDALAKALAVAGTRRSLVRLLAAVPLLRALAMLRDVPGTLAADDDHGSSHRRHRRKARHRHRTGNRKDNRKGQRNEGDKNTTSCATVGQSPRKRNRRGCCAGLSKDATGRCVAAADPCVPTCAGKACGADNGCGGTCQTGTCPACQTCSAGSCTILTDSTVCTFPSGGLDAVGQCQNGTCTCRPAGAPCNCGDPATTAGCCSFNCVVVPGGTNCLVDGGLCQ